jgi:hypothetical protein
MLDSVNSNRRARKVFKSLIQQITSRHLLGNNTYIVFNHKQKALDKKLKAFPDGKPSANALVQVITWRPLVSGIICD